MDETTGKEELKLRTLDIHVDEPQDDDSALKQSGMFSAGLFWADVSTNQREERQVRTWAGLADQLSDFQAPRTGLG